MNELMVAFAKKYGFELEKFCEVCNRVHVAERYDINTENKFAVLYYETCPENIKRNAKGPFSVAYLNAKDRQEMRDAYWDLVGSLQGGNDDHNG